MSSWLITGCSTGLGRALADDVIAAGHNAVVTARDVGKVADLAAENADRVLALSLDVTDTAQVTNVVSQAEEKFGGIDVLVNNAGYGYRAAVEEGDDSDIRTLFETQFFGAVAMIKAVLPGMRASAQAPSSTFPQSVSRSCHRAPDTTPARRLRWKACLALSAPSCSRLVSPSPSSSPADFVPTLPAAH
jgi:NAD(P)-dependent dehydrogenase (short-subunit alcohol dehydrogenase family)